MSSAKTQASSSPFLKKGRVVVVLRGRHAGSKGIIVKTYEEGTQARPWGHAIVAGIRKYPKKIAKSMPKKVLARRINVLRAYVKRVNFTHLMPTRYRVEMKFKGISKDSLDKGQRKKASNRIRTMFLERFKSGKNKWFFSKLRF